MTHAYQKCSKGCVNMKITFIPGSNAEQVKKLAHQYIAKRSMEVYKNRMKKEAAK